MATLRTKTRFRGTYIAATKTLLDGPTDAAIITAYFDQLDSLHTRGHSGVDGACPYRTAVTLPIPAGGRSSRVVLVNRTTPGTILDEAIGNFIVLDHGDNLSSAIWHPAEIVVEQGDVLAPGALIGYANATGQAFEYINGAWVRGTPGATHWHWMAFPTDTNPYGASDKELWNPLDLLVEPPLSAQRVADYVLAGGSFLYEPSNDIDGTLKVTILVPALDNPGPTGRMNDGG